MKKKIWSILKNKYFIATFIFLLFILFLGENNLLVIQRLQHNVAKTKREAEMVEAEIRQDSIEASNIIGNDEALETFGREHYYMKRENEDIFILKDE